MTDTATYEKEYFEENYKEQFEALRTEYRARTQKALQGRKIDHEPVSNIDAVVYLHDDGDGGYHVTVGDFVEFFNRRFGDSDRIGAMQRSIANAVRRKEMRREVEKKRGTESAQQKKNNVTPLRSVRPRFAFVQIFLVLLLTLSLGILGASSLLVNNSEKEVLRLEEEVAMLEATEGVGETAQFNADYNTPVYYPELSGEDSVELYPATNGGGVEMASLLNALAKLGR